MRETRRADFLKLKLFICATISAHLKKKKAKKVGFLAKGLLIIVLCKKCSNFKSIWRNMNNEDAKK